MFAIFLCIAIGHAFGDLQRGEIRKDELKGRENAGETLSPYVNETAYLDQYLQSEDVHVSAQYSSSNETETDEKPSSLVMRSPVTSGAYEIKKRGQKVNLETREADTRSLLKHSDRHISAKKDSMKFRRRFPITLAEIRNAGKDFAIHARRSFRRKRELSDSFNRMLKPVFHPKKNNGRSRQQRALKKPINTKLEKTQKEIILDVKKFREQEAELLTITQSGSSRILAASYSAMHYLLNKLPHVLKSKMLITDHAEKTVLENYVKSQSVPPETLYAYKSAKRDERELLKRLLTDIPIILSTYKALRKGVAWNYTRFHDKFKRFFQEPSTALAQYESLKRDELASLDSFLGVSSQVVAQNSIRIIDKTEVEESETQLLSEPESAATKEPERHKAEKTVKGGKAETVKAEEKQRFKEAEEQKGEKAPVAENPEKQKAEGKAKTTEVAEVPGAEEAEIQMPPKQTKADKVEKQQAEEKTKAKETAKQNDKEVETPVEDVEELKPERKQTTEKGDKQHAEEKIKAEETEEQKLQEPKRAASVEAGEPRAEKKVKAEITVKQQAGETAKTEVKEKQDSERKARAEEAETQALQEAKIATAEEAVEQKAVNKAKADEAKRQNPDGVKGVAEKKLKQIKEAENKSKAEEANKLNEQKAQHSGKTEEPEKQKSELLEIADEGKADKPANEEAAMAEERKAEELERQGNQTRNEPYCGRLEVDLTHGEKQEILQAHNDARGNENATNMLKMEWDEELAMIAQYKANTCGYFHSMHKDCNQRSLGQNLFTNFMNSKEDAYPPIDYYNITDTWAGERVNWNWTTLSCQKEKTCTQWMAVTGAKAWRLGCGKSQCPTLNVNGKWHKMANFIVCNYGPFSMDFESGDPCSNCGNSTAVADKKGFACENELCVQCDPRNNPECKCGPAYSCYHGGRYSAEICGCICPGEYYGTYCEMSCKCEDINPPLCQQHASECTSESQKTWIGITCQKMCNTCSEFPRPASCKSE